MPGAGERRVARQARLMDRMMARLAVDQIALARHERGRTFAAARRRCIPCPHTTRCAEWLDGAPDAGAVPEFCRNGALFTRFILDEG